MKIYNKLRADRLAEFCRQIGAMTGAGITLSRAMEILEHAAGNKRDAGIYHELGQRINHGQAFSDAMEEMHIFPEEMVNMFRAAEASGRLNETATRLAENYKKEHQLEDKIRTATLYPKILCLMLVTIVLFIFLVIIPMVEPLFREMELPASTKLLMRFSNGLKENGGFVFAGLIFMSVFISLLLKCRPVRRLWDRIKLYLPVIGKQLRIIYSARFARSMGNLCSSGIAMVECLEITERTIGNKYVEAQFSEIIRKVQNGSQLSQAITEAKGFDKKLAPIICVGEETGVLDTMLEHISESYEYESEAAMTRIVSLMEPAMIIVIGAVVCVILLGIMIPMWSMYEYIG